MQKSSFFNDIHFLSTQNSDKNIEPQLLFYIKF